MSHQIAWPCLDHLKSNSRKKKKYISIVCLFTELNRSAEGEDKQNLIALHIAVCGSVLIDIVGCVPVTRKQPNL